MKIEHNPKYHTISAYALGVLLLAISFYWGLSNFRLVWNGLLGVIRPIRPILYGFVLAYLLNPVMMWMEELLEKAAFYRRIPGRLRRGLLNHPALRQIAGEHHATVPQILLAFLLAQPGVLPIPRTGSAQHAQQNAAAAEIRLSAEELAQIGRASCRERV